MSAKRAAVEKRLLERMNSLTPLDTKNAELYKERLKGMTDKQFSEWIDRLESGEETLMVITPNHAKDGLTLENNLKIADSMGHSFFTKVLTVGKKGVPDHLSPIEFMVMDLPIRRLSQTSDKKMSVPKSSKVIDSLTGQVTGESKGAALSAPEIQLLSAMGFEAPLLETIKYRGGDRQGRAAINGLVAKNGQVNLETLERYASGVESTKTVQTYLTAMMLRNNLATS